MWYAYLSGIPTGYALVASDVRVAGDVALRVPAVAGYKAICAVGAGDGCERAGWVVVSTVVGDLWESVKTIVNL
jgi:hypothetical protein